MVFGEFLDFFFIGLTQVKCNLDILIYENSYIKCSVGNISLNLIIDTSSSYIIIFDSYKYEYQGKKYKYNERNLAFRKSNIKLNFNNIYGNFSGLLSKDEFIFDLNMENNIKFKSEFYFLLSRSYEYEFLPKNIDGIIGLSVNMNDNDIYKNMSLLLKMKENNLIQNLVYSFDFNKEKIIFGNIENYTQIYNKTTIDLNSFIKNEEDKFLPIKYFSSIGIKIYKNNENKNIRINNTFIPINDNLDDGIILSPDESENPNLKQYFKFLIFKFFSVHNKRNFSYKKYYLNNTFSDTNNNDILSYFIFGKKKLYYQYNWTFISKNNIHCLSLATITSLKDNIWNINPKNAFNMELISFDYDMKKIHIINSIYFADLIYEFKINLIKLIIGIIDILLIFSILYLYSLKLKIKEFKKQKSKKIGTEFTEF